MFLISHRAVNNIHSQASDPSIHHDLLPPVADLAVLTQTAGFKLITAAETTPHTAHRHALPRNAPFADIWGGGRGIACRLRPYACFVV